MVQDTNIHDMKKKIGSLFCFVCHIEIPKTTALHATLFIFLKISQWIRVHQLGLKWFKAMVWKILIIKPFFQWKVNKIEIEIVLEFEGVLGVVGKPSMTQN